MKYKPTLVSYGLSLLAAFIGSPAHAQQQKPNIVVIMADDVGIWNISAYHHGMMG
jgi:hypothetical protein